MRKTSIKHKIRISKRTTITLLLAVSFVVFFLLILNVYWYPMRMQKFQEKRNEALRFQQEQYRKRENVTIPPKPTLVPYVPGPIIERNRFDITTWKTYENTTVGIRFKYPAEWGEPTTLYSPGDTGYEYKVFFKNPISFGIGGLSTDYSYGRGGTILDFKGFSYADDQPAKLCKFYLAIYCQSSAKDVHLITGKTFGPAGVDNYGRYYGIDRPGKQIAGLMFGGGFLSPDMRVYIDTFAETDILAMESLSQAIIERRIDAPSMYLFDVYEKIFETIELW